MQCNNQAYYFDPGSVGVYCYTEPFLGYKTFKAEWSFLVLVFIIIIISSSSSSIVQSCEANIDSFSLLYLSQVRACDLRLRLLLSIIIVFLLLLCCYYYYHCHFLILIIYFITTIIIVLLLYILLLLLLLLLLLFTIGLETRSKDCLQLNIRKWQFFGIFYHSEIHDWCKLHFSLLF